MNSFSSNEVFFEDIFNEYSDDVYKLAFTYVKRKDIAEDLVQEVFVKVYKNLDKFQSNSSIKTWIISIAINQCKDYLRSAYYRYIYLSEKISFMAKGGTKTPEELVLEEFGKHLLTKDVLSLPVKYREVIILYYFQELKIKEITDVLNVNENTIKSRLSRAKEIMKKKYQERGNQDGERTNKASQGVSYK
ncbi:MAG: sigma-70 family RNA polymerase sigma factor [Bacillota bacterium]